MFVSPAPTRCMTLEFSTAYFEPRTRLGEIKRAAISRRPLGLQGEDFSILEEAPRSGAAWTARWPNPAGHLLPPGAAPWPPVPRDDTWARLHSRGCGSW